MATRRARKKPNARSRQPKPDRPARTLAAADRVAGLLSEHGVASAVIGALAVAVHGHPRDTRDFDLGTDTDPDTKLREALGALRADGFDAELALPDAEDPLGGVITLHRRGVDPIQVVNFFNPRRLGARNPGGEAIRAARPGLISGSDLRVVDLPHLVALKLYAGGPKSKLDVVELMTRNTAADRTASREVCARFDLGEEFDRLMRDANLV